MTAPVRACIQQETTGLSLGSQPGNPLLRHLR
jgi:hypothetical protein